MNSIIDFLLFIIVKAIGLLLSFLPLGLSLFIGRRLGDMAYLVNSKRRSIAYANLKASFPDKKRKELKEIARSHYRNLGMNIIELLKFPQMSPSYLKRHIEFRGTENTEKAISQEKGVILLTAHFGNWEISSLASNSLGYKMSVFAREQKYKKLDNLLNRYRQLTGCKVVTKGFSVRDIIKTLKDNGIVAMLADQDAGANGVFVDFFGRRASAATGPIVFGQKTGAVILPSFARRKDDLDHFVEINRPFELIDTKDKEKDLKANLENLNKILEGYITRFPDQWLWSHKRWKSSPDRKVLLLSDGKAGHLNQSLSAADLVKDALRRRLDRKGIKENEIVDIKICEIEFKNRFTRIFLDIASVFSGRRCQGCMRCLKFSLTKESFKRVAAQYADIVVSCGSSLASVNIFLKYENNAKNCIIMKPGFYNRGKFDRVMISKHDMPFKKSPNLVITELPLNNITNIEMDKKTSDVFGEDIAKGGVGLLVGGDAKGFSLDKEYTERLLEAALRICKDRSLGLFVTTSRRTPVEIEMYLKDKLKDDVLCRSLVIANKGNVQGIVPAILGVSDIILTTPDSVSMISEAVSSGKYVVVIKEHKSKIRQGHENKYDRIIANLERDGYIETAYPSGIYDKIAYLLKNRPKIKVLKDRDIVRDSLESIL
ncbi:MAG: ELM1/GtrOC1 family putative glycosyltransferase [Candidatus Omnitrophota bacterium]